MTIRAERLLGSRSATVRADIARYFPALVLAGYGVFILSLWARGVLTLYINPAYVGPTALAGAVLIGLALARVALRSELASCGHDACCADEMCTCDQSPPRLWPYFALCIPLLLAALVPPHSLAAFSARQRGLQVAGLTAFHGAASVRRVSLSVDTSSFTLQDWVGALSADPNPRDYLGKPIVLTGMVIHNPASVPPGYIMVIRYQVTCCIADARPVGLVVRDTSGGAMRDNQWVKVTGTMGRTSYQGQEIAVVVPKTIAITKAGDPYMY